MATDRDGHWPYRIRAGRIGATVFGLSAFVLVAAVAALVWGAVATLLTPARQPHQPPVAGLPRPTAPARAPPTSRWVEGRRRRTLDRYYPDALELFVVSLQSGATAVEAMRLLAEHADTIVGDAFADACRHIDRGQLLNDALHPLVAQLGPRALTLAATIRSSSRTGLPLAPMLERLADDARHHRRRHAETSARELPVRLTFPLVICTLPAFVLVAVAPLLIGAVSSLRA